MTADVSALAGGAEAKVPGASASSALETTAGNASLKKMTPRPVPPEKEAITFKYNPERITVSHLYTNLSTTGTQLDDQIKSLGFLEIGLGKLILVGPSTKTDVETLLKWSQPLPAPPPADGCKQQKAEPAELEFTWGEGLTWKVRLRQVTAVYTRFTAKGLPLRAELQLGMYSSLTKELPPPNPTSGGLPGRAAHVLNSSECLASLAEASYGRPGAWRGIARANGIDDPLRVAPGTAVYLPEAGEFSQAAGGAL
jgi:hypothetical protein